MANTVINSEVLRIEVNEAIKMKHEHANELALNSITSANIASWDNAAKIAGEAKSAAEQAQTAAASALGVAQGAATEAGNAASAASDALSAAGNASTAAQEAVDVAEQALSATEILKTDGDGGKFLSDDGEYKTITVGEGGVADVLVNGESVVNPEGIAEIDISGAVVTEMFAVTNPIGGMTNGTIVTAGTPLESIVKLMLNPRTPASYIQPVTNLAGSAPLSVEIGTQIMPTLTPTWTQNDAGALSQYRLLRGGEEIYSGSAAIAHTDMAFNLTEATGYQAQFTHGQGPVKNDSQGVPDPTGQIQASTRSSSTVTYTPRRMAFFGANVEAGIPSTSEEIRNFPQSTLNPANGNTLTANVPVGSGRFVGWAYPATLNAPSTITQTSFGSTNLVTQFVQTTVMVEGANGHALISYRLIYMTQVATVNVADSFVLTIGV